MIKMTCEEWVEATQGGLAICEKCYSTFPGYGENCRKAWCDNCDKDSVFGVNELLSRGKIKFTIRKTK